MMDDEIRLECLRLAVGPTNLATSATDVESAKLITERAQSYFDFVIGRTYVPTKPTAARRKVA